MVVCGWTPSIIIVTLPRREGAHISHPRVRGERERKKESEEVSERERESSK